MIVSLHFTNGLNSIKPKSINYDSRHPGFIKKIKETKIEFPCVPHIAMKINFNSFREFYDLNEEEELIWNEIFVDSKYYFSSIFHIVICSDHLQILLNYSHI